MGMEVLGTWDIDRLTMATEHSDAGEQGRWDFSVVFTRPCFLPSSCVLIAQLTFTWLIECLGPPVSPACYVGAQSHCVPGQPCL